mmetsp:Transcript_8544/g.18276  ORF Transcript_8544/g.18276 Transcript_8544/m.18276 type:complete len:444 (+) Transcript_8544:115-1446(+)|eukprot:CAMPEP_0185852888 /NCGR_PEP_ID=MMETSP1354-20130828/16765_1 /TAXON_ID=708628 /ORGANISM="Erythrolobus madagascarensis, Strain CCMP3276" /LENGTH=443 /DNA_ID=CAMNT_0028554251 /DNA_START=87 /DNA_END=1418 /DNA_ORIENTATION=+
MRLVATSEDGRVVTVEVDADAPVENVRSLLEVELSIPANEQQLLLDGKVINTSSTSATIRDAGVAESDMILVRRINSSDSTNPNSSEGSSRTGDRAAAEMIREVRSDAQRMQQLRAFSPEIARAIDSGDDESAVRLIMERLQPMVMQQQQLNADPMSEGAQKMMAERIRLENVARNMEAALEFHPEAFGVVVMLFVKASVNGHPIVAFVDSGAQSTIISQQCAARCNIDHLLDRRFRGVARGVGTANILGRIHLATLEMGGQHLNCSFTVIEDFSYDILLGLDMLRRHQACIDLERDCLRLHGTEVRFLPEKDIPPAFRGDGAGQEGGSNASNNHSSTNPSSSGSSSSSQQQNPTASAASAAAAAAAARRASQSASAAQPQQQQQQSAPSAASGGLPAGATEEKISLLTAAGFARNDAIQALVACGGDADQAASLLLQTQYGI